MESLHKIINCELIKISDRCKLNKLTLDIKKTNFITCQTSNKSIHTDNKLHIFIDNVAKEQVDKTKLLGVFIDSTSTWTDHIKTVYCKLSKNIEIICRIRHKVNYHVLLMLYRTLVQPYCEYCTGCEPFNIAWKLLS